MSNPLQDDPELKQLLQDLREIDDGSEFLKWRKNFLDLYESYLDSRGTELAYDSYKRFGKDLRGFMKNILELEGYVKSGDLSVDKTSVKARQCLSELQLKLAAVMHQLSGLCPSTKDEELQKGHTKFEMGAVLVRDGFSDYGRLEAASKVMKILSKGDLGDVADKQLLKQIEKYGDKLNQFTDIMEDLGLFTLMQKSQQFKDCPIEPPPVSMNRSTPYENTHVQEEVIPPPPPSRSTPYENTHKQDEIKEPPPEPKRERPLYIPKRSESDRFEFHMEPAKQKEPKPNPVSDDEEDDDDEPPVEKPKKQFNFQDYYHGNSDDWRISKKPQERSQSVPPPQRAPPDRSTPYAISNPNRGRDAIDRPDQGQDSESSESSESSQSSASSTSSEDTPEQLPQPTQKPDHSQPQQKPTEKQTSPEDTPRKRWFGLGRSKSERTPSTPAQRTQAPPPDKLKSNEPSLNTRPPETPRELNQASAPPKQAEKMDNPQANNNQAPKPKKRWFGRGSDKEKQKQEQKQQQQQKQQPERSQSVPPPRSRPPPEKKQGPNAKPKNGEREPPQPRGRAAPTKPKNGERKPPQPRGRTAPSTQPPPANSRKQSNQSPETEPKQSNTDDPPPEDSTIADSTKDSQAPMNQANSMEEPEQEQDEEEEGSGDGDGEPEMYTAAVVDYAGGPIRLEQRPMPSPGKGQVLIEVIACGICHSDSYTQKGSFPGVEFPRVPGHEYTGRVVSLGLEVEWPPPQTLVGVSWHGGHCLVCKICRSGNFTMCEKVNVTGVHVDGGYQEYALAHWTSVIELPKRFDPLRDAPLLGAAVGIFRALQKETDARPGDVVAIQGIGGIGHIGIQLARKMGYRVIAISTSEEKEQDALEMGAHLFIGPKSKSVTRKLQKLGGAKLIISTAPTSQVLGALVPALGLNGRLVTLGLDMKNKFGISPNNLIFNHGNIVGITPGKPTDAEDFAEFCIFQEVECRTKIFSLEEVQDAFNLMMSGNARYRVVLRIADRSKQWHD